MISIQATRQLALSLPEVVENSHFEKPDFRIKNKVFAVLHIDKSSVVVKFNLADQSVFCAFDPQVIYPIPGGWGRRGWTMINLKKVRKSMLSDALNTAWKTVAPPTLRRKYFPDE